MSQWTFSKRHRSKKTPPFSDPDAGKNIASQNHSDHGGRKQARNHFAAEIAGFSALQAAKKSLAASDFWG